MKPYGIIYKRTNTINGKVYIGQTTKDLEKRWKEHVRHSKNPRNPSYTTPFYYAIRKYGAEIFIGEIICECFTKEELDEKEKEFCIIFNAWAPNGYTCRAGRGRGTVSEETRNNISKSLMGKYVGENSPTFGRIVSEETRSKISVGVKEKLLLEETRNKLSKSHETKVYYLISPDGVKMSVTNLRKLCKDSKEKLSRTCMRRLILGETQQHKGWTRWVRTEDI